MKTKHTTGKWIHNECESGPDGCIFHDIRAQRKGFSITVATARGTNQEANAERIVACVNACEGINPEAVPEMLKALQNIENDSGTIPPAIWAMRNAAIAKATGQE